MNLVLATSYEGLGESLVVVGFWLVAIVLFLVAAALIAFRKSRQIGRKVSIAAVLFAAVQFALYLHLKEAAKLGASLITISFFVAPVLASAVIWWLTREANAQAHEDTLPKA